MIRPLLTVLLLLILLVGPAPISLAAPPAAYTATASVSNASPKQRTTVTVTGKLLKDGRPVAGAKMTATWYYKTTTSTCTGTTNAQGVASCARKIGRATAGYKVRVTLGFTSADGKTAYATTTTYFTPR